MPNFGTSQ